MRPGRSRSVSSERSCRLGETSTYFAERGRKCGKLPSLEVGRSHTVEISFEDQDTGNIVTEHIEVVHISN